MLRTVLSCAVALSVAPCALGQSWNGYGGNAQHSGVFTGISQSASGIHWQAPLDDDRSYYGGDVLAHYAAPMVTAGNTVVYGYRFTTNGGTNFDNWRVMARSGALGNVVWQMDTDFSAALIWP